MPGLKVTRRASSLAGRCGGAASAFGMAITQTIRSTRVRRGWLSQEEVDEGFGVIQLYPGAILMDLVAFVGYRLGRVRGALSR